jgi:hypothetical protein
MGFIDWIKNRNAAREQPQKTQERKPETAKEMYAREAVQEKAAERLITPEIKAQAEQAASAIRETGQRPSESAPAVPETGSSPIAQLQKQDGQENIQTALSPTDGTAGKMPSQERGKKPEKTVERPKTIPRTPPSWDR